MSHIEIKREKQSTSLPVSFAVTGLHGGAYLGVQSSQFICFYDWRSLKMVRQIEVEPVKVLPSLLLLSKLCYR